MNESDFESFVGVSGESYIKRLKKWTHSPKNFLKHIKKNGQIIGIIEATFLKNSESAQLSTLYIREDYRGKGIAQKAEQTLVDHFKKMNVSRLFLNVSEKNIRAINYYKKQGWIEGEVSQYKGALQFFKLI